MYTSATIPQKKFRLFPAQGNPYVKNLKRTSEADFDTEDYIPKRIQGFLREDRISKNTERKILKLLHQK
jgi:hypothetical protein